MKFRPVIQRHKKVVIIGGGESLTGFDFALLDNFDGAIIVVNNSILHVPRADYWMTSDLGAHAPLTAPRAGCYHFAGVPEDFQPKNKAHYLQRVKIDGLCESKNKVALGNSLYSALNLAYHFEPEKIAILGLDLYGNGHWYDRTAQFYNTQKKDATDYFNRIAGFFYLSALQLINKNVKIVNGSPESRVNCFPIMTREDVVQWIRQ